MVGMNRGIQRSGAGQWSRKGKVQVTLYFGQMLIRKEHLHLMYCNEAWKSVKPLHQPLRSCKKNGALKEAGFVSGRLNLGWHTQQDDENREVGRMHENIINRIWPMIFSASSSSHLVKCYSSTRLHPRIFCSESYRLSTKDLPLSRAGVMPTNFA